MCVIMPVLMEKYRRLLFRKDNEMKNGYVRIAAITNKITVGNPA